MLLMVRPERFELPAFSFVARRTGSQQLAPNEQKTPGVAPARSYKDFRCNPANQSNSIRVSTGHKNGHSFYGDKNDPSGGPELPRVFLIGERVWTARGEK